MSREQIKNWKPATVYELTGIYATFSNSWLEITNRIF